MSPREYVKIFYDLAVTNLTLETCFPADLYLCPYCTSIDDNKSHTDHDCQFATYLVKHGAKLSIGIVISSLSQCRLDLPSHLLLVEVPLASDVVGACASRGIGCACDLVNRRRFVQQLVGQPLGRRQHSTRVFAHHVLHQFLQLLSVQLE